MAQQFLNGAQVCAHIQQMSGVAVAQPVGVNPARQARLQSALAQPPPDIAGIQPPRRSAAPPAQRRKQRLGQRAPVAAGMEPALQRLPRLPRQRQHALFAALAPHAHHPAVQIHIAHIQRHQFAHPHAGAVEQLEHRPVAQRRRAFGGCGRAGRCGGGLCGAFGGCDLGRAVEQGVAIVHRQRLGQAARGAGRGNANGGIGPARAAAHQVAEEAAQRGQLAPQGGGGLPAVAGGQEAAHIFGAHRLRAAPFSHKGRELPHIGGVGAPRVGRKVALCAQVPLEAVEGRRPVQSQVASRARA